VVPLPGGGVFDARRLREIAAAYCRWQLPVGEELVQVDQVTTQATNLAQRVWQSFQAPFPDGMRGVASLLCQQAAQRDNSWRRLGLGHPAILEPYVGEARS